MAFGFPPKYAQEHYPDHNDTTHFLTAAMIAAEELGWTCGPVSPQGFTAYAPRTFSSYGEEIAVQVHAGMVVVTSRCLGSQILDWGKNKRNVHAFLEAAALASEQKDADIWTAKQQALQEALAEPSSEVGMKVMTDTSSGRLIDLFIPRQGYGVTPVLVNLNILIFILMLISGVHWLMPGTEELLQWGANFRPYTLNGQWWRLLTSCFLHIGLLHLLLNMYALVYIGVLLEPYLGKARFLTAYLLSGIVASASSLWWNDVTVSAGASGAIFGMYGVFLALLTTNLIDKAARRSLLISIIIFVGYNLLYGLKPGSGVDNAAHIGGLLSGLLIGYAIVPGLKNKDRQSLVWMPLTLLASLLMAGTVWVYQHTNNDIGVYQQKMQVFIGNEARALKVYGMLQDPNSTKEGVLAEIDSGIYYWKENLQVLGPLAPLDLPETIKKRNQLLVTYCTLRIESYTLMYKAIDEDTAEYYEKQLLRTNQQIESLLATLSAEGEES